MSIQEANKIRAQHKILAEGEDLMAPITSFKVIFESMCFTEGYEVTTGVFRYS